MRSSTADAAGAAGAARPSYRPGLSVLVVSARPAIARRLRAALACDDELGLAGCASQPDQGARLALRLRPAVTLWDASELDARETASASASLATARASSRVLLCESHPNGDRMLRAVALGLWGCVALSAGDDVLRRAVHAVHRGELWLPRRALSEALIELSHLHGVDREAMPHPLSEREREIALWMSHGMMNKEIAKRLGISDKTVKTHVQHIFKKTDLHRRSQLAIRFSEEASLHA
jgi:DNA-binding NarL/FixJ family response regulator